VILCKVKYGDEKDKDYSRFKWRCEKTMSRVPSHTILYNTSHNMAAQTTDHTTHWHIKTFHRFNPLKSAVSSEPNHYD
jgi:hypothetical protein